jgi:two-component system, NarL family, sensor histidine kinase LiaS
MITDDATSGESDRARHRITIDSRLAVRECAPTVSSLLERACTAAVSEEHARWTGELHDTIAQDLTALRLLLERAQADLASGDVEPAAMSLARALGTSRECARQLRHFMRGAPMAHEFPFGLGCALRAWVDRLAHSRRLRFYVRIRSADRGLDAEAQGELYRIAQEALANAIRHSDADRIRITWKRIDSHWLLCIEDNGIGFDVRRRACPEPGGIGLKILVERARRIGAQLHCHSVPGRGTLISVRLPGSVPPHRIPRDE